MGDLEEIQKAIEHKLQERSRGLVNRNALSALFGAVSDPVGSLGKIFLGRQDVLDSEKSRLTQDVILELVINIDRSLSEAMEKMSAQGVSVEGLIEVKVETADRVVGAEISSAAKNVRLQPGTHIKVDAGSARGVTGLKIGG